MIKKNKVLKRKIADELIIRIPNTKDLKKCEELLDSRELKSPGGEVCDEKELISHLEENYFLVAELDNEVVGCLIAERLIQNGAMIWYIVVNPKYRGHNIGTRLLESFEDGVQKEEITWIILYSDLKNKKTVNFYKKNKYFNGNKCVEFMKKF